MHGTGTEIPLGASTRTRSMVGFALAAVAMVAIPFGLNQLINQPKSVTHTIEIPAGTAERVAAGESVDVLPPDLEFALKDRLVLVNNDSESHTVGPFNVAAGQRLERRLSQAISFNGFCSLHTDARISLRVSGKR